MSHIITCERCGNRWLYDDTVISNYCGDCAGRAFLGGPMTETEQLLKLSVIYTDLLQQLEDMVGVKFPSIHQAMQVVDDAVERACLIKQSNPPLQFKPREFHKPDE